MPPVHRQRPFLCAAVAASLAALGCVDHNEGGRTLYLFDNASKQVKVWSDVNALYNLTNGATVPGPDRSIGCASLAGITLAWGGLAVDSTSNRVYLLSQTGTVYVIPNAGTANGTLADDGTNFYSFSLGTSSDRYSNDVFGQVAVDPTTNRLYAMETTLTGDKSRVWKVASASGQYYTTLAAASSTTNAGDDKYGAGVAVMNGGEAFGLFGNGNTIFGGTGGTDSFTGARIRLTSGTSFVSDPGRGTINYMGNVIIGGSTGLTASLTYGALAYDNSNSQLYVLAQGSAPVLVWNRSQFGYTYNQASVRALGNDSGLLTSLRTISHPYDSDWLLGAYYTSAPSDTDTGAGGTSILLWKAPSGGSTPVQVALPGSLEVRGLAIGGGSD